MTARKSKPPSPISVRTAWQEYRAALRTGNYAKIQVSLGRLALHPRVLRWALICSVTVVMLTAWAVMLIL